MIERVVDVLVLLPEFLVILDNLADDDTKRLVNPTKDLLARLDSIWQEYESEAELRSRNFLGNNDYQVCAYPDAFTSMTVSYFDCARVVLLSILAIVAPDLNSDYSSEITHSCESILSCVAFIDTHDIGCAYLSVIFPLVLVYSNSPSESHRWAAYRTLQKWQSESMMTGASATALHSLGIIATNREGLKQMRI
jgi:hypothetical protein